MGRNPLTIGAIILLGLSAYESWIRLEDFQAWILGVKHLSDVRGTSFLEDLAIIFEVPAMKQMGFKMLYLLAMVIFGIVCLVRRNRRRGNWFLFLLAMASAAGGIFLEIYAVNSWVQILKLVPLALIALGSVLNMLHRSGRGPHHDTQSLPGQTTAAGRSLPGQQATEAGRPLPGQATAAGRSLPGQATAAGRSLPGQTTAAGRSLPGQVTTAGQQIPPPRKGRV